MLQEIYAEKETTAMRGILRASHIYILDIHILVSAKLKQRILLLLLFFFAIISIRLFSYTIPRFLFTNLIEGNDIINIRSIRIDRSDIAIRDEESLLYINDALKNCKGSSNYSRNPGVYVDAIVSFGIMGTARCAVMFEKDLSEACISEPIDILLPHDPFLYYRVRLPRPIPQSLIDLLQDYDKPVPQFPVEGIPKVM